jgi:hypothetical protein
MVGGGKEVSTTTTTHDSSGGPLFSKKSHCLRLWIALKKVNRIESNCIENCTHKRTAEVTADPSMDKHSLTFPPRVVFSM